MIERKKAMTDAEKKAVEKKRVEAAKKDEATKKAKV